MFKEFREFIAKGNVFDMAIGIIIGAAFSKIVSSLVSDIVTPILGMVTGGINFKNLAIILKEGHGDVPPLAIKYGNFIETTIDFLLIAFSVFMFIKFIAAIKAKTLAEKKIEEVIPEDPKEVKLLQEIRDLLKKDTE